LALDPPLAPMPFAILEDPPTRTVPAPRIAVVAGLEITEDRLEARMAEVRRGPRGRHVPPEGGDESKQFRRWIVQELVTRAVLVHETRAAGLVDPPESGSGPAEPGLSTLPDAAIARLFELVTRDVAVSEVDSRAYYERNLDLFRSAEVRHVRHRLSGTAAEARAAARDIEGGAPWDLRRGAFSGPFEDAVFSAAAGDLVGPIESELGWHVARLERIQVAGIVPFDEARPTIEEELLVAARARTFGGWLEGRRQALSVIEPEWEHPGHPVHGTARHRH
jgi:hypothetical protein